MPIGVGDVCSYHEIVIARQMKEVGTGAIVYRDLQFQRRPTNAADYLRRDVGDPSIRGFERFNHLVQTPTANTRSTATSCGETRTFITRYENSNAWAGRTRLRTVSSRLRSSIGQPTGSKRPRRRAICIASSEGKLIQLARAARPEKGPMRNLGRGSGSAPTGAAPKMSCRCSLRRV